MKYRFDEIAINSTKKKKPEDSDKTHYIGLEHLDPQNLFVTRYGSEVAPIGEKLLMKKGDVLFGKRRAYQKKVSIAPFDGIFSAHGMVLRPNEEIVNKDYFPFFISSDYFLNEAIRISVGSLSPTINWRDLRELEFSLPPLKEQERLAKVLWAAYELKESYRKLIDATDEMVKGQFIEMFGDMPQKNTYNLEDIVNIHNNLRKPLNDSVRNNMKSGKLYPYYGATGVVDYINQYSIDFIALCIAEDCGTYEAGAVSSYIIREKCWVNNHAHVVVPDKNICNIEYLHYYLTYSDLTQHVTGTTRTKMTRSEMIKIQVYIPPMFKQDEFVQITQQAEQSKAQLQLSINKIEDVMKSLLP